MPLSFLLRTLVWIALCTSVSAQGLADRLSERWRWRELRSQASAGRHHVVTSTDDGTIFSTSAAGVWSYDGVRWEQRSAVDPFANFASVRAYAHGDGFLFQTGATYRLLGREGTISDLPYPGLNLSQELIHPLADGRALISTTEGVVLLLPGGGHELLSALGDVLVHGAGLDSAGRLIVCSGSGWLLWDWVTAPRALEVPRTAGQEYRYRCLGSRQGKLWFAPSWDAPSRRLLSWDGDRIQTHGGNRALLDAVIFGDAVVAAYRSGGLLVFPLAEQRWIELPPLADLDDQFVRIIAHPSGRLVCTTATGRLWQCDLGSERWRVLPVGQGRASSTILSLAAAENGDVWLGTNRGVHRHDGTKLVETIDSVGEVPLEVVTGVCEDTAGGLWLSSGSGFPGVFHRAPDGTWRHITEPFANHNVHCVERGLGNGLWFLLLGEQGMVGDPGGGIVHYDGGQWQHYDHRHGVVGGRCYDIAFDGSGMAYVATEDGIVRRSGDRWMAFGATGRGYRVLHFDGAGGLWAASGIYSPGLWRIDRETGAASPVVADRIAPSVAGICDASDGSLLLTSESGLFRFRDGLFNRVTREPGFGGLSFWPVLQRGVGEYVLGSLGRGLIRYTPDDERSPVFQGLDVTAGDSNRAAVAVWRAEDPWHTTPRRDLRYRWRIDGQPWSEETFEESVTLPALPAGTHFFEVMAYDLAGNGSSGRGAEFRIAAPLLERTIVKIALILLAIGLVVVIGFAAQQRRLRNELRRGAQKRLEASERNFRELVERAELVFATFTASGGILYTSPSLGRLLGKDESWRPGSVSEICGVVGDDAPLSRMLREATEHGSIWSTEVPVDVEGRPRRWLYAQVSRRTQPDSGPGIDLVGVDVSERKDAEAQREELESRLRQSQKLEAMGQLAAGIAHDFNNILTVVLGNLELIRNGLDSGMDVAANLGYAEDSARRAASLTRQLLVFGRQQVLEPVVLDLSVVLQDLRQIVERLLPEHIETEFHAAADVHSIEFDRGQLEQVLINLVVNARDAMPEGGELRVEVHNSSTRDSEHSELSCESVVIRVQDTGHGMDAEVQKRVFDPFFTTKPVGQGTGLGLATVHGIVRQSGGTVHLESEVGRGTTFEIHVPAAGQAVRVDLPIEPPVLQARSGETLLLCEDEDAVREVLRSALEDLGYLVIESRDGAQAIERAASTSRRIDALVTDVVMPRMNGRELAETLRRSHPELRVVFVSGYSRDVFEAGDLDDPGYEFLAKPFQTAELASRLRQLLDQRSVARSSGSNGAGETNGTS